GSFIVAIAGSNNNKATTSGTAFTFDVKGLQAGQTALECTARVSKGDNVLSDLPSVGTNLSVLGILPTPTETESPIPTLSSTLVESSTPVEPPPIFTATPTAPPNDWLIFTNSFYGFEFKYPSEGVIADGQTDNFARIDLPFIQGTNLSEKYLEVTVTENATTCKSPLGSQSSETIIINGIQFLKENGAEGGAGHLRQWVAYSTERDNVCVSLGFILHSLNAGNFPTPPPVFDFSAESAVFGQMVETFTWLAQTPTATPGFETPLPFGSPTPTITSTPIVTVTGTPMSEAGLIVGKVFASKLVRIEAYDGDNNLVGAAWVNTDG
ncbi:MAG: hypothetical protein M3R47_01635, partial [Chloroflexota bacterium]|nr:hypothetical protein [Chloroflexota bacterium]